MANNTISIYFQPCQPTPAAGYRVSYRPQGSSIPFRVWPDNFLTSPAIFTDTNDPEGTSYEGFIQGDCGDDLLGVHVPFTANNGESPSSSGSVSGSGSDSSSAPCDGNPIQGAPGSDEVSICGEPLENLFLDPGHMIIQPGATLYFDACLTMPVTGFPFVKDAGGVIYNLDIDEGIVGSPTGNSC